MRDSLSPQARAASLLSTEAAAQFLGVSPRTLHNWRWLGKGPVFVRVGTAVRYNPDDLRAYTHQNTFASTSAADAGTEAA